MQVLGDPSRGYVQADWLGKGMLCIKQGGKSPRANDVPASSAAPQHQGELALCPPTPCIQGS